MSRANDRAGLPESQRIRYLEDDMDRSEARHEKADQKFEALAKQTAKAIEVIEESTDRKIDALKEGQIANQRALIGLLAGVIVSMLFLAMRLAGVG